MLKRVSSIIICFCFIANTLVPPALAQSINLLNLPVPGTMVSPSQGFVPILIKGMVINPTQPLQFDFIVDSGNSKANETEIKKESERLAKYFLAALTIPKGELWVNLSPYEKDEVVPAELGQTELGRDMLAQDYILKQLTATLVNPEKDLGKTFWTTVRQQVKEKFGTDDLPINTFNKVWIVPSKATVFEKNNTAYIVESSLKVMLDSDYWALENNKDNKDIGAADVSEGDMTEINDLSSQIVREIVIPAIEKEVNEGANFAPIRQIYHSLILAQWYKEAIKESLLSQVYIDQRKVTGVDVDDKTIKDQIYDRYIEAYKKGVFEYIKEDYDPKNQEIAMRQYFSGGLDWLDMNVSRTSDPSVLTDTRQIGNLYREAISIKPQQKNPYADSAQLSLTSEQKAISDEAARKFGLAPWDQKYLNALWLQRLNKGQAGGQQPFRIVTDRSKPGDGENFILASMLTPQERKELLGATDYLDLVKDPKYTALNTRIAVTINPLDGGIGETLNRLEEKKSRARKLGLPTENVKLSAKGTDLGYDVVVQGQPVFVSIAEARILQLIGDADKSQFAKLRFEPLVNWQSKAAYEELLDKTVYLYDRLTPGSSKRTYRQVMEEKGIEVLPLLEQADLPGFDVESGNINLDPSASRQPGGHGQWGFYFLYNTFKNAPPEDGSVNIRVFYNGDNKNGYADKTIAQAMVKENWPVVKLTTVAVGLDKKGGKDGVRIVYVDGKPVYVPDQMELGDAKAAKQQTIFEEAGQEGGLGEVGRQPFNTNIFYINSNLVHDILTELADVIGEEELEKFIAPSVIDKDAKTYGEGKKFIPVDGAIGTAMHRLNAFFLTSTNPKVKEILTKRGLDRVLYFVDVPRTPFFAPVKQSTDMFLQTGTNYYDFDVDTWMLKDARSNTVPPELTFTSTGPDGKDDKYWNEVYNVRTALVEDGQRMDVSKLRSLTIKGKVRMVGIKAEGDVTVINKRPDIFDLNTPAVRTSNPELFQNDQLTLVNMEVTVNEDGSITTRKISSNRDAASLANTKAGLIFEVLRTELSPLSLREISDLLNPDQRLNLQPAFLLLWKLGLTTKFIDDQAFQLSDGVEPYFADILPIVDKLGAKASEDEIQAARKKIEAIVGRTLPYNRAAPILEFPVLHRPDAAELIDVSIISGIPLVYLSEKVDPGAFSAIFENGPLSVTILASTGVLAVAAWRYMDSRYVNQIVQEYGNGRVLDPEIRAEVVRNIGFLNRALNGNRERIANLMFTWTRDEVGPAIASLRAEIARSRDSAGLSNSKDVGGIDLNDIDIRRTGEGIDVRFVPEDLKPIINQGVDGFTPVIMNIIPIPSIMPLLGLEQGQEDALKVSALN